LSRPKNLNAKKKFVEKHAENLQHRLDSVKEETGVSAKRKLQENSKLLYECNELRREVSNLKKKLEIKKNEIDILNRKIENMPVINSSKNNSLTNYYTANTASMNNNNTLDSAFDNNINKLNKAKNGISNFDEFAININNKTMNKKIDHNVKFDHQNSNGVLDIQKTKMNHNEHNSNNNINNNLILSSSAPLLTSAGPLRATNKIEVTLAKTNQIPQQKNSGSKMYLFESLQVNNNMNNDDQQDKNNNIDLSMMMSIKNSNKFNNININNEPLSISSRPFSLNTNKLTTTNTSASTRGNGKHKSGGQMDMHAEKLTAEIEFLGNQLDESQRERDVQRLELNRLRKQLVLLSQGNNFLSNNQVQKSNLHSNNNNNNNTNTSNGLLTISSNNAANNNNHNNTISHTSNNAIKASNNTNTSSTFNSIQLPSIGVYNAVSSELNLTNADMNGMPSEEDKKELKFAPTSSTSTKNSSKNKKPIPAVKNSKKFNKNGEPNFINSDSVMSGTISLDGSIDEVFSSKRKNGSKK